MLNPAPKGIRAWYCTDCNQQPQTKPLAALFSYLGHFVKFGRQHGAKNEALKNWSESKLLYFLHGSISLQLSCRSGEIENNAETSKNIFENYIPKRQ